MKKNVLASVTMAAVLLGGAYFLPVRAQERSDPLSQIVSMQFENANVRDALRQVAANMGMPIEIEPSIQGTVSLSLANVTNQVLLTNLTRQVDATLTIREGTLVVRHRSSKIQRISGDRSPGGTFVQVASTINVEAKGTDVREALRTIFRQSGASYAISPEVQGTVSASLQNVTMDTALAAVLRQVDATYLIEAGVYHIVRRESPTRPEPAPGSWSSEPPVVAQDNKYLYLISSGKIVKIRKSDLKVEQERSIPVQWGNQTPRFGGS